MKLKIFLHLIFIGILSSEAFCQIILPGDKYFTNVDFDTLQKVFAKLSDYDKRYFLESIPKYYSQNKIKEVPEWLKAGTVNAIASNDQQLVIRAINVSGKFRIEESIPALTDLYRTARYKFGIIDTSFRELISNTLIAIDPYKASVSLSDLLLNPPRYKPDIIQAVKIIGTVCRNEIISSIDEFLRELEDEIRNDSIENKNTKPENDNGKLTKDKYYKDALLLVQKLKVDILTREGKHE